MGLFDRFKRMKDPVRGTAQVITCSRHGKGIYSNCHMQLVVQADGVPARPVDHHDGSVHQGKWPFPGMTLPVTVDRANPERIKIEWDEVTPARERGAQQAEQLAAMMRGETPQAGMLPLGGAASVNVVDLSGGDLSQLSPEQRTKLQMLGIDPALLAARQSGMPPQAPPQEAMADADEEVDEQLARLAKLGQLRDAGVLTPAEFEEQKRRILEG